MRLYIPATATKSHVTASATISETYRRLASATGKFDVIPLRATLLNRRVRLEYPDVRQQTGDVFPVPVQKKTGTGKGDLGSAHETNFSFSNIRECFLRFF